MHELKLKVNEMFTSLQGEGPFTGRPAFFLRLTGCIAPLCPFCDTPDAWEKGRSRLEDRLLKKGVDIQYETSGKVPIPSLCKGVVICSPKQVNGTWQFTRENISRADGFKFVARDNLADIRAFVETHGIPKEKVWVMPLGATLVVRYTGRRIRVCRFHQKGRIDITPFRTHGIPFSPGGDWPDPGTLGRFARQ